VRPKSLPGGWVEARLSEVTQINPPNPEVRPDDDALVSFVPMAAVRAMGAGIDTIHRGSRPDGSFFTFEPFFSTLR